MSRLQGLLARLRAVLRPGDAEGRMEEEFRFHLEMEQARLVRDGLSPVEARRQARLTFGGQDAHRETMRDERGARWLGDLGADLRYALRAMRRSPGYALAVALILGVGIGVNGIVAGYVNAVLFRPIPARAPEQLVALFQRDTRTGRIGELGYGDYVDYRERSGAFADLAAMSGVPLNVAIPGASGAVAGDMVWGEMVTENYFTVLGMTPAAGRFFQPTDAPQGANPLVVLSYECWRRRFQADRNIAGRVVRLNGAEFTVTGVAPRGFRGMLFVRSLVAARTMDLGFDARDRALVSFNVGLQGYDERRGRAFYDQVLARVRALPGIAAAGLARPVPFDTYGQTTAWYVGDFANSRDGTTRISTSVTSDGFVAALGLRLEDGRDFTPGDSASAPPVMIVSRSVATRLWPGRSPLGQQVRYGGVEGPQVTVVGVVDDARFAVIGELPGGHLYLPVRQHYRGWQTLVVGTRGDPAAMLPRLERVLASLDPTLPVFGKMTMEEAVTSGFSTSRTAATFAGFFGVLALLIASLGLYALVAGAVAERTREIGVRLALGCTPAGVLRLMMGEGARLGAIGLGIGLVGAFGVARAMGGLLYGLSPGDPVTFVLVPLALGVVVLLATYFPARRAVRLDPVAALRSE